MDALNDRLFGFLMVLTRVSAFFLLVPVFSWEAIPVRIRVSAAFLLAVFFSMITPVAMDSRHISAMQAVLLTANEVVYGLALGLVVYVLFSVVKLSGHIIEQEMGLSMAEVLDPLTGEPGQPVGSMLEMIFIILFLAANGHHLFLLIIQRSYEVFPPGHTPAISALLGGVIESGSVMLTAGLRLAGPVVAGLLIVLIALAILARVVPEMDIFFISFPLRIGLGLLLIAMFVPLINEFIGEFTRMINKLLPL
jgi:flagellar biosynthetic protein FliR